MTRSSRAARANEELAAYVRAHTTPDDRMFLFGISGAGVYFLSDRLAAHRFLRVNLFVPDGLPDPQCTLGAVVEELRARQPAYVILEQLHSETEMGRAVDARIEDFTLYRRR